MKLDARLQRTLESLYRLEDGPPVSDFRIGRDLFAQVLGPDSDAQREALLVHYDGDETLVALFICDEVMARARRFQEACAEPGSLDAFCVATEGVSHYVYFTFAGEQQERPVSQVELELQAEVDKFILLRVLYGLSGEHLVDALFDSARFAARLSPAERERYRVAHQLGRRYARWFDRTFRSGTRERALDDARRLYRKSFTQKLEHIARAA
jgi:hypothetical protein